MASKRTDIEGLRAIAVLLVVAFHVGWPRGGFVGVDIFFVISGYLITGILLRELDRDGSIRLVPFYARRARRLLPAAALVLIVTAAATSRWAPPLHRATFEIDIASAGAFAVNWPFAVRAVDYWARDIGRSPVLHFWSLSVEEQFYLIWPSFILLTGVVARRIGRPARRVLAGALSLVVFVSLAWWLVFTWMNPHGTFFVTGARLWELGLGAALELLRPRLAMWPRAGRLAIAGAGLIAFGGISSDSDIGWHALLPTVGAALVIGAGTASPQNIVARCLSWRPLVWIGGLSYSIYLWHWPCLIVTQDWLRLREGPLAGAVFAALSIVPAWLSYRFLERPIRFSRVLAERPALSVSIGVNLALASVAVAVLFAFSSTAAQPALAGPPALGAAALGAHPRESEAGIPKDAYPRMTPSPATAANDLTRGHFAGCLAAAGENTPHWCEIGDPHGSLRAVLVGDSKIFQYNDVIDEAARALGLRISTAAKAGCPFSAAEPTYRSLPAKSCNAFNAVLLEQLRALKPDLLITSQLDNIGRLPEHALESREDMVEGLVTNWSEVHSWHTKIVVILDNPAPNVGSIDSCLLGNWNNATKCAFDRTRAIADSGAPAQLAAAARVPGTRVLDFTDYICPRDVCAPVIGDVLVYRQTSHLTATYAQTLLPIFLRELRAALRD